MTISRNDPCWCGSERKFKKCHLNREKESRPLKSEAIKHSKKIASRKECLHPSAGRDSCNGDIIRAHAISKRANLAHLAVEGKVLCFKIGLGDLIKNEGGWTPRLDGINRASTFGGFCARHDSETFKVIDTAPFSSVPEHMFLHGYRSICYEVHAKNAVVASRDCFLESDKGRSLEGQRVYQEHMGAFVEAQVAGRDDITRQKRAYDSMLLSHRFDELNYYAIVLAKSPAIMCAGATEVVFDCEGRQLQDLTKLSCPTDAITCCVLGDGKQGLVVFTWIGESSINSRFVDTLDKQPDAVVGDTILRFAVSNFENLFASPAWWGSLSVDFQEEVGRLAKYFADPRVEVPADYLSPNTRPIMGWVVEDRIRRDGGIAKE